MSLNTGFVVHPDKSTLEPAQVVTFVGFVVNTILMQVTLTDKKAHKLKLAATALLQKSHHPVSIQTVAELVGMMVAAFPGVQYAPMYYRTLDNEKSAALRHVQGNYEACMQLSVTARADIQWWVDNIETSSKPIHQTKPDIVLQSDASSMGWGGIRDSTRTGGEWSSIEGTLHINCLQLMAAQFTVQSLCSMERDVHIHIQVDNVTALAYINSMGGKKSQCNHVARRLWDWAKSRNIWLSASHLAGVANTAADQQSRLSHENTEWALHSGIFRCLTSAWDTPTLDMFASRLNNQVDRYVSWQPDPGAAYVDAFSMAWGDKGLLYLFPPFCLISRVLSKLHHERAEAIVIAPLWTTQSWFPHLLHLLIDCPFLLPRTEMVLSHPSRPSSTLPRMRLVACRLSGKASPREEFQTKLRESSCPRGGNLRADSTASSFVDGMSFAMDGNAIHFHRL